MLDVVGIAGGSTTRSNEETTYLRRLSSSALPCTEYLLFPSSPLQGRRGRIECVAEFHRAGNLLSSAWIGLTVRIRARFRLLYCSSSFVLRAIVDPNQPFPSIRRILICGCCYRDSFVSSCCCDATIPIRGRCCYRRHRRHRRRRRLRRVISRLCDDVCGCSKTFRFLHPSCLFLLSLRRSSLLPLLPFRVVGFLYFRF